MTRQLKLSPKVGHVVSSRVECPFSGSGLHAMDIFLSNDGDLLHVTSECLERYGPAAVEGMQGLADESTQAACFDHVDCVHKLVRGQLQGRVDAPNKPVAGALHAIVKVIEEKRVNRRVVVESLPSRKQVALSTLAKRLNLNCFSFTLPSYSSFGSWDRKLHTEEKNPRLEIRFRNRYTIAYRTPEGKVALNPRDIEYAAREEASVNSKQPKTYCVACKKHYDRMPTHVASASHRKKMAKFLEIAVSLFSREGLQQLNNEGLESFAPKNKRKKRRKRDEITGELLPREVNNERLFPF